MRPLFFFLCLCLLFHSCLTQKNKPTGLLQLDGQHVVLLLDSAKAAYTLLQDKTDRYFERVTASEMSIQMKKPLEAGQTRENMLPAFKQYLRADVAGFSPEEAALVSEVMREVFETCKTVSPATFPDTLKLIKTKAKHYGESVYYTRENCIVIPYDVLSASMRNAFKSTMFHELFHVYSRLHPQKQAKLYKLIGFETLGLSKLQLPDGLAGRVLYNPDGVDFAQKISLKSADGTIIEAVPVIFSNNEGYKPGKKAFFAYVEFNIYQIEPGADGTWKVLTKPDGFSSTLDLRSQPDFFRQIKDNTGYIIHPDEVLADNFMFIMEEKTNPSVSAKFSPEGKKLLTDMEAVIKE